jgi:hypothetical protein
MNGINAKAQRRREWWPSAKTFAPSRLGVLALNFYAAPTGLDFILVWDKPRSTNAPAISSFQ